MPPPMPARPNWSAAGEPRFTEIPAGVIARFQSTKIRCSPCEKPPEYSPRTRVPFSIRITLPLADQISLGMTQLVSPGCVESIAVCNPHRICAPAVTRKLRLPLREAETCWIDIPLRSQEHTSELQSL